MSSALPRGLVLITAAVLLSACATTSGSTTSPSTSGTTGTSSTSGGGGTSTSGGGSTSTSGGGSSTGGGGGSTTGGGGSTSGSGGAHFNLVASPDNASCNYIPNGALSGADQLSVEFYFLIIGGNPSDVPGGLSVTGSSDTGLSTSYRTSPNNQALSVAQFALRPGDFGVLHTIKIVVDSAGQVAETDESDNTIVVSVRLPSPRPSATIDPLACTVTRG